MEKKTTSWYSPSLHTEMPIAVYGHYGWALLLIPTAAADYLEYERFQLLESIRPNIEGGQLKVYSINSMNTESWMNDHKNDSSQDTGIIICGASFGALHSMNLFLRRPDLINGVIAMSGVYDLTTYTKGYWDEDVYFNSPQHYLPNLSDHNTLEQIRRSGHIHLLTGSGPHEAPDAARSFAGVLYNKGIWYELDVWGQEWSHDWPTWRAMLPHYLGTRF